MKIAPSRFPPLVVVLVGILLSHFPAAWSQSCGKCDGGVSTPSRPKIPDHPEEASTNMHGFVHGIAVLPRLTEVGPSPPDITPPPTPSQPYETFALFLFPNNGWIKDNHSDIGVLKQVFENFGHAIGTSHLAVWLAIDDAGKQIDTARARQLCAKFSCPDDTGPHIILTSVNPDRWQWNQDEVLRLSLKGIRAERASRVLAVLEEDLLKFRAGNPLPDRVEWAKVFEVLRESIDIRNLKEEIVVAFRKP